MSGCGKKLEKVNADRLAAVTLQDIADKAGVSRATVSRALKNHPRIGRETTQRIQSIADEMGYRRDARLTELMTRLRKRKISKDRPVMALLLWQSRVPENIRLADSGKIWSGLWSRAWESGYQPEMFNIGEFKENRKRLAGILYARGIRGIILCPAERVAPLPDFSWHQFSVVAIGHSLVSENVHRCANNYFDGMLTCIARLASLGYRRIGLVMSSLLDQRTHGYYPAAYLFHQQLAKDLHFAPLFYLNNADDSIPFDRWYRASAPDVIICASSVEIVHGWLHKMGVNVPENVGLVDLKAPSREGYSGIHQHGFEVGVAAVDLLVSLLQNNETGLPEVPREIFVKGRWIEGTSTR